MWTYRRFDFTTNTIIYVALIVLDFFFIYYAWKRWGQLRDLHKFLYVLVIVAIVLFIIANLLNLFNIDFAFTDQTSSVLYAIANGFMAGGIFVLLGFNVGPLDLKYQIILFGIVILFSFLGMGYLGFVICVNFWLPESCWISNTGQGLIFFAGNWAIFLALVVFSFITETERKTAVEGKK